MSDTLEPYEQDMAWLKERMPEADEGLMEAFADKVSHLVLDLNQSVCTARLDVYAMVLSGSLK